MSAALVEQFSDDFHPEQFTDEYQAELRRLLEAKLEEGDTVDTDATFGKQSSGEDSEESGKVISLMDALERSVRRRRGGDTGAGDDGEKSGDTKKSGSKKSSSKKSGGAKKSGSTKKSGSKKSGGTKKSGTAKKSGGSKKSA